MITKILLVLKHLCRSTGNADFFKRQFCDSHTCKKQLKIFPRGSGVSSFYRWSIVKRPMYCFKWWTVLWCLFLSTNVSKIGIRNIKYLSPSLNDSHLDGFASCSWMLSMALRYWLITTLTCGSWWSPKAHEINSLVSLFYQCDVDVGSTTSGHALLGSVFTEPSIRPISTGVFSFLVGLQKC